MDEYSKKKNAIKCGMMGMDWIYLTQERNSGG